MSQTGERAQSKRTARLGHAGRSGQGPGDYPRARDDAGTRGAAPGDRSAHGPLSGPPLGRAAGAGGRATRARVVLAAGDRPGGMRDAGHTGRARRGGDVLRHARERARWRAQRVRVHEHLLLAVRRGRAVRGDPRRGGRRSGLQRARVRVPGRVRHRADGLRRRRLCRSAYDRGRTPVAGRRPRRTGRAPGQATCKAGVRGSRRAGA